MNRRRAELLLGRGAPSPGDGPQVEQVEQVVGATETEVLYPLYDGVGSAPQFSEDRQVEKAVDFRGQDDLENT